MKPDERLTVANGYEKAQLDAMRKIYRFHGFDSLSGGTFVRTGLPAVQLNKASQIRTLVSGVKTLTMFATMSDLKPLAKPHALDFYWGKAAEHLRRAIKEESAKTTAAEAAVTVADKADTCERRHEAA